MRRKKKKKSFLQKLLARKVLLSIQLLVSIVFVFLLRALQVLPSLYFMAVAVLILLLWLIITRWMSKAFKKYKREGQGMPLIASKMVSIALSIVLVFGSSYILRGNSFLDVITGAIEETYVVSVYVLEGSDITDIADLADKKIGVTQDRNPKYVNKGVAELETDIDASLSLVESDDYIALATALYEHEVDAIIVDESYLSIMINKYEHFKAQTTSLQSYRYVENVKFSSNEIDVTSNPFVMYVTGIDAYGDVSTVSRTDVNLVLVINPIDKQILMVSIPRDMQVTLASFKEMDKLTHSAMYGINETLETLEDFLQIDFNYYAKTNFTGIVDIIDVLGGVEIDSPYEDFVTHHGDYVVKKGLNSFNGDQALCFVRERYALENGDLDRGKNQQLLLKAMLEKAMSTAVITNFNSLLSAIEASFETNMSSDSIRSLINMQLDDMASWDMYSVQVTGDFETSYDTYSMPRTETETIIPDADRLEKIIALIDKVEAGETISDADVEAIE